MIGSVKVRPLEYTAAPLADPLTQPAPLTHQTLRAAAAALLLATGAACAPAPTAPLPEPVAEPLPDVAREFRGLWVATVANIDWPSQRGLTAAQQQAELISILDRAAAAGFNAIVFHVRPAADAVYESALEPWGIMLTGTQGVSPGWDPLAYAVQAAHRRGMELHAWVNPFRAGNASDTVRLAANHIYYARHDLVRVYGTQLWLDPGEPEAQQHSLRVISDIVTRYDVDGVHLDDYFYPYPQTATGGGTLPFPDSATYGRYGGGISLADWRRANVDRFVERLYTEVHAVRPFARVGISPFGIWRPNNPPGITGLDAYAAIYADSRKWLQNGWVDYFAPQLYWAIAPPQQSFPALLDWWLAQNARGRHVWPGLAAYRVNDGTASAFSLAEILTQVSVTRARATKGHLLYNTTATLTRAGGAVAAALAADPYRQRALPPAYPWLQATPPSVPTIAAAPQPDGSLALAVTPAAGEQLRWAVARYRADGRWTMRTLFAAEPSHVLTAAGRIDSLVVNGVDRAGNLSPPVGWSGALAVSQSSQPTTPDP
jgi:uncharacterized lipoprotein YddW (UPF0748 family)